MKMKLPREPAQGSSGYWGGVGSRPARTPWTPEVHKADASPAHDRKRLSIPRLQLRRRRRARPQDHDDVLPAPIVVAIVVIGLFILSILLFA